MDRRHPHRGPCPARCGRLRPQGARPHGDALVPQARHARRLLPRRHAPGQPVRRQRRAASWRSTSASWGGSAPRSAASSPRSSSGSSRATTSAQPRCTSGRLRAAASSRRGVRAGAARDRRADPRTHRRGDLHGGPLGPALRLHRGLRHADPARADPPAEDHGRRRRAWRAGSTRASTCGPRPSRSRANGSRRTWARSDACARPAKAPPTIGKVLADLPALLTQGQATAVALAEMARSGFRLDEETVRSLRQGAGPAHAAGAV